MHQLLEAPVSRVAAEIVKQRPGLCLCGIFVLRSYFEDSKATLVINGVCSGVCPDIFISGTVRRFAYPQAGKQGPVFLIRSAVFTGDLSGAANIPDIYARFRPIIGEVISNALLRKHTNGVYMDGALLIFAPSPGEKGNGYVLDCDDLNNIKNTCKLVAGADLLNTNIITAAGPLDLNAPSAAPATQSAPAEKP